jgi:hypothetical protein
MQSSLADRPERFVSRAEMAAIMGVSLATVDRMVHVLRYALR